MELNGVLFPSPTPSYESESFRSDMIWVPNTRGRAKIPCLYLRCEKGSSKVLVYFHGNAEDVGLSYNLMDHLRCALRVHVLAVEYPNYGVYPGQTSAERIIEDAERVFEYLTVECQLSPRDIIVFGRSIGSGPATWLASHFTPCALILMSAYTSIRAVVKHLVGPVAQYFLAERFNNLSLMPGVTCPTFLLHGQVDTLIPYTHSQALLEVCSGLSSLVMPPDMDHNSFDYYEDLTRPLARFWRHCGISTAVKEGQLSYLPFEESAFEPPHLSPETLPKGRWPRLYRLFCK